MFGSNMMTSSNGNIFRITGPLWGESTSDWRIPLTKKVIWSCNVFFDLTQKKRLSKQSSLWWFEMPSHSLWHHCNDMTQYCIQHISDYSRIYIRLSAHKIKTPGPWFNIKTSSFQYRKSHCIDKTIVRLSYLRSGNSYTGMKASLYRHTNLILMGYLLAF